MNRTDLAALQTFVAIAEKGSLRAAARHLGVNPPAVSAQLKAFEDRLGTPLFLRSTRSLALTDAGRALYDGSHHLLGGLDKALSQARTATRSRVGTLRVTLPFRAWQLIIAPRLTGFQAAYPGIDLDLTIDEGLTDILARGLHAGIRLGDYLQQDMIAVRLSPQEQGAYVASPDYLRHRGVPQRPEDLLHHACIRHRQISSGQIAEWRFTGSGGEVVVNVGGTLVLNDLRTVIDAASASFGIGWSLYRGVARHIDEGRLVQVLAKLTPPRPGFFLYFPKSLQQFSILRCFIEHFREGETARQTIKADPPPHRPLT
ncbi:MAG: LysR family transcriptional regulator [Paracoccaceae bacterium]